LRLLGLELRNYRNYSRLDLEPGSQLNLFLGANGQGKTNLLESVAMLALSSSPRARRDTELVGPLAPEARIAAVVESGSKRAEVRITILVDGERARRRIEVDGQPRRAVDLPGLFRVTLFWPDDLNLVKSGPEHRRRLLNQMLVQVQPGYARALGRYARVIEQRNSLLKQVAMGEQPPSALEVWDLELARVGGEIALARSRAMEALAVGAASAHAAISGGERLELEYLGPPQDLLRAVENSRAEDLRRGSTSVGPHRDDVLIRLAGRDARGFASQGQQRTAVVSLKLAEAELVGQMTGERPVLLLDDVLSELDRERRAALLESLSEPGQVVITSVEAEPFPASVIDRSVVRCIEAGRVQGCG
jgi:DNA replication and repair protein RecF